MLAVRDRAVSVVVVVAQLHVVRCANDLPSERLSLGSWAVSVFFCSVPALGGGGKKGGRCRRLALVLALSSPLRPRVVDPSAMADGIIASAAASAQLGWV